MVVAVIGGGGLGQPLEGGGWPLQGAQDGQVVLIGCFLLPLLIPLVYYHLLLLVVFWVRARVPGSVMRAQLNQVGYYLYRLIV